MNNEIWFYSKGFYKAFTQKYKTKRKMDGWSRCKLHCSYFMPDGTRGWDYIFPSKLHKRVTKLLNLPWQEK